MLVSLEKKKTEKVDVLKPLTKYIKGAYNDQAVTDHQEALNAFSQLREDVRNSVADRSEQAKETLLKYHGLLKFVEMRFPICENNVRLNFVWFDIWKGRKASQFSPSYERANVMFSIAAAYSQLGTATSRATTEGPKQAAAHFQTAAGVLTQLIEYLGMHVDLQSTLIDLSTEALKALCEIMLGNAQYCFFEKAIKSGMNKAILSKLGSQVVAYYETGLKMLMTSPQLRDAVNKQWLASVEISAESCKADVCQYVCEELEAASKFGERIARLKQTLTIVDEARKKLAKAGLTGQSAVDLKSHLDGVFTSVEVSLQKAIKENEIIYHEDVPAVGPLDCSNGKSMVKPIPLPDSSESSVVDPFSRLVPFQVKQALSQYQERKDGLVRGELAALDEANNILKQSLASMNLPGCVEALDAPEGIPPAVLEKANQLRAEGGPAHIADLQETISKLRSTDLEILDAATRALDEEEKEDNDLRGQYGQKWSRTPSHALTSSLRQEISKHRGNCEHAGKSDALVAKKWESVATAAVKLAGPEGDLVAFLPRGAAGGKIMSSPALAAVKQGLAALNTLVNQREKLRADLQSVAAHDEPSAALMGAQEAAFPAIFDVEMHKYDLMIKGLRDGLSSQAQLLQKLSADNAAFVQELRNANGPGSASREEALQALASAFSVFNEVKSNIREGIVFYTNFQEVLSKLRTKCEDFALARRTEKDDLLEQIRGMQPGMAAPVSRASPQQPAASLYGQPAPGAWNPSAAPSYGTSKPTPPPPPPPPPQQQQQPPPPPPGGPYGAPQQYSGPYAPQPGGYGTPSPYGQPVPAPAPYGQPQQYAGYMPTPAPAPQGYGCPPQQYPPQQQPQQYPPPPQQQQQQQPYPPPQQQGYPPYGAPAPYGYPPQQYRR